MQSRNTREFLVRWNAATEEHLVHKARSPSPVLRRAASRKSGHALAPSGARDAGCRGAGWRRAGRRHYLEDLADGSGE